MGDLMSGASGYNSNIGSVVACPIDILIGQETANWPSNMSSGHATTLPRYHARDVNRWFWLKALFIFFIVLDIFLSLNKSFEWAVEGNMTPSASAM